MPRTPGSVRSALATTALLCGCGAAAIGPGAASPPSPAPPAHRAPAFATWVHVTAPVPGGTLELLAPDGHVLRSLPGGELTGDGGRLLTVAPSAAGSRLRMLDSRTGAVIDQRSLPAGFHLPNLGLARHPVALAPGDTFAALDDRPADTKPGSVSATHLAVVDLRSGGTTRFITLAGDFEVDALSSDGSQLYLIESLPRAADGAVDYRVRRVDVATATLDPTVVVDKTDGEAAMAGVPVSRAPGGDAGWVLTIYAFGPHGAFVHELGLDAQIAVCVDLPAATPGHDEAQQRLWSLVGGAGGRLYAINGGTGQVVELVGSGGPSALGRAVALPLAGSSAGIAAIATTPKGRTVSTGAVLSPDGATLYAIGDAGIIAVDTATLSSTRVLGADLRSSGLAISPDGTTLLSVGDDGASVALVDVRSGAVTHVRRDPGVQIDAVVGAGSAG